MKKYCHCFYCFLW